MEHIVRSVLGAHLQTSQLLGLPLTIPANSTLNQKFDIQKDTLPSDQDKVSLRYVTIGNGGHRMVQGVNGISKPEPVQHTPRNTALYNHLPFVLRLPNEDLDNVQRLKYRLRRQETHNGTVYIAYYLKVLDLGNTVPQLEFRTVQDGVTTSTPFTPTLSDLNPTPPAITAGGVLVTTGDYIASTAKVPFIMNSDDLEEFLNVCNIIYNDDTYAMISEIGLCSGVDRAVTGNFNGISSGYTEAIGVQICTYISSFFSAKFNSQRLGLTLDLGNVEPLLALQN